jgi:ribosomal protein S18 acetylase RimI-like enzyme
MIIGSTPFRNEQDYADMHQLIVENYLFSNQQLYPSIADLDYWRYIYDDSPENIHQAQLWRDSTTKLLGFVWMTAEATDLVCHYQHRALEENMLEWAEQQYLLRYSTVGVPDYHHIYVFDCDPEREAIAARRGYLKTEVYNYYGRRNLSEFIAPLDLPSGYMIRSVAEEDIAQRAALNVLAGGGDVSEEKYRQMMMAALTYRQSLDLVAIGPNGEVAAFCTVWIDEQSGCGVVEPYGCASKHRRKRLGRNLLQEGMRRLKALGARWVYVTHAGCEGDEIDAALELNRSVGFEPVGKNYLWRKETRGT